MIGRRADLCDCLYVTSDSKNTLVDAWDDLADAGLDARLVTEVCDVFTALADDDASIFCGDEGTEGEGVLGGGRGRARVGDGVV